MIELYFFCYFKFTIIFFLTIDHTKISHINGKSHKQKCEFKEKQNLTLERSVYVRGFDPMLKSLETRLESLFSMYGGKVKDVYVDKNSVRKSTFLHQKRITHFLFLYYYNYYFENERNFISLET